MTARTPFFLLAILLLLPISAGAATAQVGAGSGEWRWNLPLLGQMGLQPVAGGQAAIEDGQWQRFSVALAGAVSFRLEDGHVPRFLSGQFRVEPGLSLVETPQLRRGGERSTALPDLRGLLLRAAAEPGVAFELVDQRGAVWFDLAHGHRGIDAARQLLTVRHMDVRISRRLALALGKADLSGIAVGVAHLDLRLDAGFSPLVPNSIAACNSPLWPGQPGAVVDVQLATIIDVQAQCSQTCAAQCLSDCSGAGAPSALVKIAPSARLLNVGSADVPWLQKFTAPGVPIPVQFTHPYPQPDVHPFLVWSVYRINAAGQLEQIARSGLKHAFATGNEGCSCPNSHILAPGCSDEYDVGTNDTGAFLTPRREVIPFSGIWGRCRSFYDADCDGAPMNVELGPFEQRAVVSEADLAPAQNPSAQYFVEAWYMVRDDSNIDNNIASVSIAPQWNGSIWITPIQGALVAGAALNRWVAAGSAAADRRNETVITSLGRAQLAVRVSALAGGLFRYDYAFFNRDFGAPVTLGVEPNLELLRNRGFGGISLPISSSAIVLSTDFHDGDRDAGNQWSPLRGASSLNFIAPVGNPLDWGSLYRISIVADAGPVAGNATLTVAEVGALADPQLATLVPGVGNGLFGDSFE